MNIAGRKLSHLTTVAAVLAFASLLMAGVDLSINYKEARRLSTIRAEAVRLDEDSSLADLDGRIVYTEGVASGWSDSRDADFNLNVTSLLLERDSQVYQRKKGGTADEAEWQDDPVQSKKSGRGGDTANSAAIKYPDFTTTPSQIGILSGGKMLANLDLSYVGLLGKPQKISLTQGMFEGMPIDVRNRFAVSDGSLVEARNGVVGEPQIGDNRTRFLAVPPMKVTVVGYLRNGVIVPDHPALGNVAFVHPGLGGIETIFETASSATFKSAVALGFLAALAMLLSVIFAVFDFKGASRIRNIIRFGR